MFLAIIFLLTQYAFHVFENISTLRLSFFIREVKNHLNYEHRVFNSEEFLKTRALGDQQFYKQVRGVWGLCACLYSILHTFLCLKYFSHPGFPASVNTLFCVLAFLEVCLSVGPTDPFTSSYFLNWLFRVIYM